MNTPDNVETPPTDAASHDERGVTPLSPFPKRVVEVFFSPGRLTEGLAAKPRWGAALLLGLVLAIAATALIPADVWQAMIREQMVARGQDASAFPGGASVVRIFGLLSVVVGYLVMTMVSAGIVTLAFSFVLGDEGRFKQYLAVITHAFLIAGIIGLALVPLRIAQADPRVTLNVGTFLFFLPDGYLRRWVTMMDLSSLWAWLVVAQGAHAVNPRRSFGSAAGVVVGIFLVTTALFALIPGAG
jgi:hypothetical protein